MKWNIAVWFAIALNVGQYLWQALAVVRRRSGEAVSVVWFASSFGLELVNAVYGNIRHSNLFVLNAIVCAVGQLMVLMALGVYKPFGRREKAVVAAMALLIAGARLLPFKNAMQMAAQALNLYGGADQPVQLRAALGTGALKFWSLLMSALSAVIWSAYCLKEFGFWGPAAGYLGFSAYSVFMVFQWCKKARSANPL